MTLINGDCLDEFKNIEKNSIDLILTDLPYGTTACKWDTIIPFDKLWEMVNYLLKPNGVFITTASQPFTSALIMSNPKMFKYEWIWSKNMGGNFLMAEKQPMKQHENILVFSIKNNNYYPIKENRLESGLKRVKSSSVKGGGSSEMSVYGERNKTIKKYDDKRFPQTVQKFNVERGFHPTQKPVALFEYLTKTYTNEYETVLDICMGSGTTGVACKNLNRNFIGIEMDDNYFKIASERINNHTVQTKLL